MSLKQSFARWCFAKIEIRALCEMAKRIGFEGIDLVDVAEWPVLHDFGLVCSLASSHSIVTGLNDPRNHVECDRILRRQIEASAANGCPNVVCFSGNRGEIDDVSGAQHCVEALRKVAPFAEAMNVTLCLELLNSKDHGSYMCDRSAWGVDVCKRVHSKRVKLLYDIYHMQRMEGDLIQTIDLHADHFGHVHAAGNPGRNELDDMQEIHYPAVIRALARRRFTGWIGHEFLPIGEPESALRQAYELVAGAWES